MSEPARKTRKVLTLQEKVEILQKIDRGTKQLALADEYGVTPSTISHLKASKAAIEAEVGTCSLQRKTL